MFWLKFLYAHQYLQRHNYFEWNNGGWKCGPPPNTLWMSIFFSSSLRLKCLSLYPHSTEVNFIIKFSLIGLCQWGVLSLGGKWHRSYRKTEAMSPCLQSQLLCFHIYLLHKYQALLFLKNIKLQQSLKLHPRTHAGISHTGAKWDVGKETL